MKKDVLSLRPGEAERYWKYVQVRGPDECWPWKGAHVQKGYGSFMRSEGPGPKYIGAHVMGFLVMNGPIPDGPNGKPLGVLHRCDNRDCQNSRAHHFLGDAHDNMRDMQVKGRRKGYDVRPMPGVLNGRAKLTDAQVDEIRRLWDQRRNRPITQSELSQRFKVAPSRISAICRRQTYVPTERKSHAAAATHTPQRRR